MCGSPQGAWRLSLVAWALVLAGAGAGAVDNALPPPNGLHRLWEEIAAVKAMMAAISGELSRFNALYLGKLEQRMLSIATALSSVDSNVKNLQERAHVWDTFQLHVAAWNEQIKTLDRKVDILSRGHEKLDIMDGRLSSLLGLEYKVERVAGRLQTADERLSALTRALDAHLHPPPPPRAAPSPAPGPAPALWGDLAARGVASALRGVERKLERLIAAHATPTATARAKGKSGGGGGGWRAAGAEGADEEGVEVGAGAGEEGRGKLIIRCNAPAALHSLLRDVAAKVDVMFDKMAAPASLEAADGPGRGYVPAGDKRDLDNNKLLERGWKRVSTALKRSARAQASLEAAVRASAASAEASLRHCAASAASARRLEQRLAASAAAAAEQSQELRLDLRRRFDALHHACAAGFNVSSSGRQPCIEMPSFGDTDPVLTTTESLPSPEPPNNRSSRDPSFDSPRENPDSNAGSGDGEADDSDIDPLFIPVVAGAYARNCEDLLGNTYPRKSGIFKFGNHELTSKSRDFYTRYCDMHTNGGGWTVIQRRGLFAGPRQKFSLNWKDYKRGFGDLDKEFWFGNDFIHRLTYQKDMILRIELGAFDGRTAWAEYSNFRVGPAESNYRLTIGGYSGNATDSFLIHDGASFSTVDRSNDGAPSCCPCAPAYGGGWWFDRADGEQYTSHENSCFEANLNGVYFSPNEPREEYRGIIWEHWLGDESLKYVEMKIRPKILSSSVTPEDPSFDDHSASSVDDVDPLDIPEDP